MTTVSCGRNFSEQIAKGLVLQPDLIACRYLACAGSKRNASRYAVELKDHLARALALIPWTARKSHESSHMNTLRRDAKKGNIDTQQAGPRPTQPACKPRAHLECLKFVLD